MCHSTCSFFNLKQKLSVDGKEGGPKRHTEDFTDESNDVIFVEAPVTKKPQTSFKNIFPRENHEITDKAVKSPPTASNIPEMEKQSKDSLTKAKIDINAVTKRTDWDMFAEQDIDSNFDVSFYL